MIGGTGAVVYVTSARQMLALDHDPAPGDVAGVRVVVAGLRRHAEELSTVRGHLAHPGDGLWSGRTATIVVSWFDLIARRVDGLVVSLDAAAEQLEGWAVRLAGLQERADALDREAAVAEAAVSAVRSDIQLAAFRTGGVGVIEMAHRRALVSAADGLDDVHRRVRELEQDYEAAARVVGGRLAGAPPVLDLGRLEVSSAVRASARHIDSAADWAASAANVLDLLSVGLLLLGGTAPAALVTKSGALVLGGAATTGRVALAAGAGGSWWDAGVEAVALAGGGVLVRTGVDHARRTATGAADATGGTAQRDLRDEVREMAADSWQEETRSLLLGDDPTSGLTWTATAAELGGRTGVELTVHDVQDQWDVGAGFAHTAVLPVRVSAPAAATPRRPTTVGTGPSSTGTTGPATPAGPPRPAPRSAPTSHPPAPG